MQKIINEKRILSLVGMAKKAGRTISGTDAVVNAIEAGEVYLVIVTKDASERTKKNFRLAVSNTGLPIFTFSTMDLLGKYLGKEQRAVCGIADRGFARKLIEFLERYNEMEETNNIKNTSDTDAEV